MPTSQIVLPHDSFEKLDYMSFYHPFDLNHERSLNFFVMQQLVKIFFKQNPNLDRFRRQIKHDQIRGRLLMSHSSTDMTNVLLSMSASIVLL